ncbi:MAG: tRNA (adenosine(37)-N6)-threonylcarbamoyltransferase complex ATPase subunit type 1 TsaE [Saprospiraceae bacterium]|nr:tRNA (adenosine(37)-N6)-threonylcarbamoyltransferase complex ATPase subunit type 1 TsaE [Saprospiraceae bacterium]MDZ4706596.1 tRNA (adenosine(37)-N6)-threonylcarbamoyltransferase complex ATPase subunit type 1 TsaE [Saprospiraceae bacterium]
MEEIEFDLIQIDTAAETLLQRMGDRRKVALYGPMGAGKTTFVRALCRVLGIAENVSSPTFAIVNEYSLAESGDAVYHLDLYRLKTLQEALDIGVENYLEDAAYCFIEWPELIEPLLPPDALRIKLELVNDSQRKILFL